MKRIGALALVLLVGVATGMQTGGQRADAAQGAVTGIVQLRNAGVTEPFAAVEISLSEGSVPGGAVVATTSTIGDGTYSLAVEEGAYTLTAEPPDASGLTPTSRSITVTPDGTTTENFLFTIVESQLTVSGVVTGPDGSPISGAVVAFVGPEDDDGGTATTNALGAYSLDVLPRSYAVSVNVSQIAPFPSRYSLGATDVAITADTTLDIQVPGSTVTIDVVDDSTGAPVTALVIAESRQPGPTILGRPSTVNSVLDEVSVTGTIDVVLAPGGSAFTSATATDYFGASETFALPGTSTVTLRLVPEPDPDETRLTGRLLDSENTPLAGASVIVTTSEPQPGTDANGEFDVVADAPLGGGVSSVELRSPFTGALTPVVPPLWSLRSSEVPHPEGGQTDIGDIVLAAEPVTINVVDPDGVAVPAAFFDASDFPVFPRSPAPFGPYAGQVQTRYGSDITADAGGSMSLRLADNSGATGFFREYQMTFSPPAGVDTCTFSDYNLVSTVRSFDVTGPTTVTVEMRADRDDPRCDGGPLVPETEVTGTLLLGGTPVERTFVGFLTPSTDGGESRVGAATNAAGAFSADIVDGEHRMDVVWSFPTDVWPRLRLESDEPVVTIDQSDDPGPIPLGTFDVPLEDLAVTVLTPDGRPIPGVTVSTPEFPTVSFQMNGFDFSGTSNFPGSPSTDLDGEATLPLLPGTYDLLFTPDAGFVPFTLRDVVLPEGGAGVQVQLAYPHTPPTATITPTGASTTAGVFEGTVSIDIAAEAFDGFAVESVSVTVDGGAPFEYTGPFPVTALGERTVVVQVTDDGSVTGPPVSSTFTIVEATDETSTTTTAPPDQTSTTTTTTATTTTAPPDQTSTTTTTTTATTTTAPPDQTSTTVSSDPEPPRADPTVPSTDSNSAPTTVAGSSMNLPETGVGVDLTLAALLVVAGACLMVVARRPRTT